MDNLLKKLQERRRFEEEIQRRRKEEIEHLADRGTEAPPVFNKHHYSAKGSVIITDAAREIMAKNERSLADRRHHVLGPSELVAMRGVVDGLKLVHKGLDYVKDALSHVVTAETYAPYSHVPERDHELVPPCFYVVYGLVEVTYDAAFCADRTSAVRVFEPNIVYTNGSGEYVGLVSADGRQYDMTPPATVYTRAESLLVRIDRDGFHGYVTRIRDELERDKWMFLESRNGPLSYISVEEKRKLVPAFTKVRYNPNKILTREGQLSDILYIIVSGHCRSVRSVHLKDAGATYLMYTGEFEPGDIVGSECLDDGVPYYSTVYTSTYTTCFKFHRADLEAITKENLQRLRELYLVKFPDEGELHNKGYRTAAWRRYRRHQVMLVKDKHLVTPLHLPLDVRWGTISEEEIKSKMFITFLASSGRPETGSMTYNGISRTASAYPARGKHPIYDTRKQTKSAPCRFPKGSVTSSSSAKSSTGKMASQKSLDFDEVESEHVVRDRATYSSLGARHIVRQATEVAEVKYRRRVSSVKSNQSLEDDSLYTAILDANLSSKNHCAFGRYRLEILRKRLERVRESRRSMEEERRRRAEERQFQRELRKPQT